MKQTRIIFTIIAVIALTGGPLVSRAQTASTEKALQNLKESVDALVGAKDENNPNDVVFRMEAFKKVIDLSVTEAQDIKIKLIAATDGEKSTSTLAWKDAAVARVNDALKFYDMENEYIKDHPVMTQDEVKALADQFKTWRATTYIPLSDEITNYLLIQQENKAVATTEARWQKIQNDIAKLTKAYGPKKIQQLTDLLAETASSTKEAGDSNDAAFSLFKTTYIDPIFATSTEETATSTAEQNIDTATTTDVSGTPDSPSPLSIRDLVDHSLAKVKETYQTFIEMSSLVRKLLT